MIIVSACLAGCRTRYDGCSRPDVEIVRMVEAGEAIAVCPEQLGGLSTPRPKSEITDQGDGSDVLDAGAAVVDSNGRDVTGEFIRGAYEVLRIARTFAINQAILKDRSPSCGTSRIYKRGDLVSGKGVSTALLERNGIQVTSPMSAQSKE